MTCEIGAPEQLRVDMTNAVHIHSWRHPDVDLRSAPQGGFQLSTSALLPGVTFLPCMLVWENGSSTPTPNGTPPLLEGFLDRSGWGHPSRSGHQPDSVGILNQGCVTKSGPICSARARWDCCAGLIPASLRGRKGARDKERHKLKEHTGGVDLTAHLSAT